MVLKSVKKPSDSSLRCILNGALCSQTQMEQARAQTHRQAEDTCIKKNLLLSSGGREFSQGDDDQGHNHRRAQESSDYDGTDGSRTQRPYERKERLRTAQRAGGHSELKACGRNCIHKSLDTWSTPDCPAPGPGRPSVVPNNL